MKLYKIYEIKFPTGEVYIGKTFRHEFIRWAQHMEECEQGRHNNPRIQEIYNEYGYDDWEYKVIAVEESDDSSYIALLEEYHIKNTPNTLNVKHQNNPKYKTKEYKREYNKKYYREKGWYVKRSEVKS